ncbi:MAG: 7-cyano-7-deazaguanine synthase QueC [Proteobacteria bacterium]|nr:7-cyano-7-deazaguanine synthase QueC [Pseudomonadota bacterium]
MGLPFDLRPCSLDDADDGVADRWTDAIAGNQHHSLGHARLRQISGRRIPAAGAFVAVEAREDAKGGALGASGATVPQEARAVVLLSGGLDSAVCLALARAAGQRCFALTVRYGQRHAAELRAAARVAAALGADQHLELALDLRAIGGSALTDAIAVPKARAAEDIGAGVPVTYVPARNTMFLACALAWAEVLDARHIYIGVNALDYSGYPDCRPAFIAAFQALADQATAMGTERGARLLIEAPLLALDKAAIVRQGVALGVDFSLTHSCYDPLADDRACGACDACLLRRKGFALAGVVDPLRYAAEASS